MKKILCFALAIWLALSLIACGEPAAATSPSALTVAMSAVVTFADPVLEMKVRAAMGRPEGDITAAEAEAVTEMNFDIEWQIDVSEETTITNLGGLEYFKNLKSLNLSSHAVTDISPLKGLTKLTSLSLSNNSVADISPLAGLTNLKALILTGCKAQDYASLAKLVNLDFLMLDHAAITDVSPLASLTGLKQLYLADCPITDYSPLTEIYSTLEEKDFIMAFTLAELGFTMNDANNQASYGDVQRDGLSVNINHAEWGAPQSEDMTKCVRMDLMLDSGYTLVVLYYPEISAYVFQMNINGEQMNYIYDAADGTVMVDSNNRERFERMITEALGETDAEDILLAPIPVFNETIKTTLGVTADALYALPFEQAAAPPSATAVVSYALPYEQLGFTADTANAACIYEQQEPHYMCIAIHRSEWGENPDGWNIEFNDSDVNGYKLHILYYEAEGLYRVSIEKDGAEAGIETRPVTGDKGGEWPDLDTAHRMFNDAFGTKEKELYDWAPAYFERVIQERFGMNINELYALRADE